MKGVLVGIERMILFKSKGGIGCNICWKLTEVEERILGWNFRGVCMHK